MANPFDSWRQYVSRRKLKRKRNPVPHQGAGGEMSGIVAQEGDMSITGMPQAHWIGHGGSLPPGFGKTRVIQPQPWISPMRSPLDGLFGKYNQSPMQYLPLHPNVQGHFMG